MGTLEIMEFHETCYGSAMRHATAIRTKEWSAVDVCVEQFEIRFLHPIP